jgi:HEAT repeat protein
MNTIADAVHAALVPFLALTATALFILVCHVLVHHGVREWGLRRRERLLALYRPAVAALLHEASDDALTRLRAIPHRHRPIVASLLMEPLRVADGPLTSRARQAAEALGLVAHWEAALSGRRWWLRADAALALGLLKQTSAVEALIRALDDPYDEVRAAAVDALGQAGDLRGIVPLVARLNEQSRHQRVRLVHALQHFGAAAAPSLLEHAQSHPEDLAAIADLLGNTTASSALPALTVWTTDTRAEVRAAAIRAIGAIGVDERTYYYVLRALNDEAADVRAAAAWTIGRSGRSEAAAYLADRLTDQWQVAAQSARALRRLGDAGRDVLEASAEREDGELARQMLWEDRALSRV